MKYEPPPTAAAPAPHPASDARPGIRDASPLPSNRSNSSCSVEIQQPLRSRIGISTRRFPLQISPAARHLGCGRGAEISRYAKLAVYPNHGIDTDQQTKEITRGLRYASWFLLKNSRSPFLLHAVMSSVSAVSCTSHEPNALRDAICEALELVGKPLHAIVRRGERVLIKPYLRHGSTRDPASRAVSHPALIEAVAGLVTDCGGRITLGDVPSIDHRTQRIDPNDIWIYLLAERCQAEVVSFARAGAIVKSGLKEPSHYLITRAITDASVIISLANPQPHPFFLWNGAVKNMFNALVGKSDKRLYKLLPTCEDISSAIADVCRVARPTITIADMVNVRPGYKTDMWPVGFIAASCDPVALDSVCVQALGWDPTRIPTLIWGKQLGVGEWQHHEIQLCGMQWSAFPVYRAPFPSPLVIAPESRLRRRWRLINHTTLRPRPIIDPKRCASCDECIAACPVGAISYDSRNTLKVDLALCGDCEICINSCPHQAITMKHCGTAGVLSAPMRLTKAAWQWAKVDHVMPLGRFAVRWNVERRKRITSRRTGAQ